MAVRWRIPFYIRGGNLCHVNIYDDNYSGTVTTLTGNTSPIVISEDDDDNVMLPIRTSTGHINLIAESNLSDIFPSEVFSRFVTLTSGGSTLWQGYIQVSNNDMIWDAFPLEVQLPLVSCLGALSKVEMPAPDNGFGVYKLRQFLKKAFDASGTTATTFVYPGEWTGGNILDAKLQEFAFFEESGIDPDSPDFKLYTGITYLELLERIMTFLGWTLYERGSQIIAISRSATSYFSVPIENLSDPTFILTPVTRSIVNLPAIADNNHSQSIIPPCGTINIKASAEGTDDIDIDISPNNPYVHFGEAIALHAGHGIESLASDSFEGYRIDIDKRNCDIIPHEYQITYFREFDDEPLVIDSIDEINPTSFDDFMSVADGVDDGERIRYTHFGAQFYHADIWPTSTVGKKKYDYKDFVGIVISPSYDNVQERYVGLSEEQLKANPVLTLRSKKPIHFANGIICIKTDFLEELSDFRSLFVRIKIGNQYFSKTSAILPGSWVSQESWIQVTLRQDDKTSYTVYKEYNDAEGVIIPTGSAQLAGNIEIAIAPNVQDIGHFVGSLSSFNVSTMLPDLYGGIGRLEDNNYYGDTGTANENIDVNLDIITMNNNVPCKNCLWWNDTFFTNQLFFGGVASRPEFVLANKYKQQCGRKREVLKITCEYSDIQPYNTISINSAWYLILSAEHDYYEKTTTLKLISI